MDDNLDGMKRQWQQLLARTADLELANKELARKLGESKLESIQDRLARRTALTGWIGLLLPVLAPLVYYQMMMPVWIAVLYGCFGVMTSMSSFMFSEYIKEEKLTEMPVARAIERASKIKRRQALLRIAGIAMCLGIVILMAVWLPTGEEREPIIVGGSVGLAVGLVVGIRRSVIDARLARQLIQSLK